MNPESSASSCTAAAPTSRSQRGGGDHVLRRYTAGCHRYEALVTRSRAAVGNRRRHPGNRIHAGCAGGNQSVADIWKLGVEHLAHACQEEVWLTKLHDPTALPTP